jgi:hypothetical protein
MFLLLAQTKCLCLQCTEGYATTVTEGSRMSAFMYEIHTRLSCCTLKFRDHFQRQRRRGEIKKANFETRLNALLHKGGHFQHVSSIFMCFSNTELTDSLWSFCHLCMKWSELCQQLLKPVHYKMHLRVKLYRTNKESAVFWTLSSTILFLGPCIL